MKFGITLLAAILSLGVAMGNLEARPHGQALDYEQSDLAVNMNVDGIHPKYDNRVPASWHPVDTVEMKPQENIAPEMMRSWPVTTKDEGGTLLFSDSPEYVREDGILYSDVVNGSGRLFYYHLNNTHKNKKLAVILTNEQGTLGQFEITRAGISEPSTDYLYVGKTAQTAYMASEVHESVLVFAHQSRLMLGEMDKTVVGPGELVNGIYDFVTNQPMRITVMMYSAHEKPLEFFKKARVLPRDEVALRGTYQGMNRVISSEQSYNPDRDGAVYIPLAENLHDLYKKGIDATDGTETVNYGNYGIMYQLSLPTEGTGETQYFLSPLGGVYAGAMTVRTEQQAKADVLPTPLQKFYFGDSTPSESEEEVKAWELGTDYINNGTELTDLGVYDHQQSIRFEFSPPGASNLPVNFILMPASQGRGLAYKWKKR